MVAMVVFLLLVAAASATQDARDQAEQPPEQNKEESYQSDQLRKPAGRTETTIKATTVLRLVTMSPVVVVGTTATAHCSASYTN